MDMRTSEQTPRGAVSATASDLKYGGAGLTHTRFVEDTSGSSPEMRLDRDEPRPSKVSTGVVRMAVESLHSFELAPSPSSPRLVETPM